MTDTIYLIPEDLHARMQDLALLRQRVRDHYETWDVYKLRRDTAQLLRDLVARKRELGCITLEKA